MGLIDKGAILGAQDIATEDVPVPEWGAEASVRVRELPADELLGFWDTCRDDKGELVPGRVQPALLARAIIDADGAPMFTDADVGMLMKKSAKVIGRLFLSAKKLNGIGQEAEGLAKNSDAAPSGDSPSASASPSA